WQAPTENHFPTGIKQIKPVSAQHTRLVPGSLVNQIQKALEDSACFCDSKDEQIT
ncbi:Hypothetical predicted protein, partial [Podarcis lilfordi]